MFPEVTLFNYSIWCNHRTLGLEESLKCLLSLPFFSVQSLSRVRPGFLCTPLVMRHSLPLKEAQFILG